MARVRYLGGEPVTVPELGRLVQPDELVTVPDARFEGYICQSATWESVEEPADWVWPKNESDEPDQAEPPAEAAPVEARSAPKKTTVAKPTLTKGA